MEKLNFDEKTSKFRGAGAMPQKQVSKIREEIGMAQIKEEKKKRVTKPPKIPKPK
jgi:hypothetical protein